MKIPQIKNKLEQRKSRPFERMLAGFVIGSCVLLLSLGAFGSDGKPGPDASPNAQRIQRQPPPGQPDGFVPPGEDCFFTQCGDMNMNLTLPSGFFGPGSAPFEGSISLGGENRDPGGDTIVQRQSDMDLGEVGSAAMVPIEMVWLSLKSCEPITVTTNGQPNQWDVSVALSDTQTPTGMMTVIKTHANGGTFDANLPLQPVFTFTDVNNPSNVRVFDTGEMGMPPYHVQTLGRAPWVHQTDHSDTCGTNFVPGVKEDPTTRQQCHVPVCTFSGWVIQCASPSREVRSVCSRADTDNFDSVVMMILELFDRIFETHLQGPTVVNRGPFRGDPQGDIGSDTEIVRMNLFGLTTGDQELDFVQVQAGTDSGLPSPGRTTLTRSEGGEFIIDSFFDITYQIDFVGQPQKTGLPFQHVRTKEPIRIEAQIDALPPLGQAYRTASTFSPVPLVDDDGVAVGRILGVVLFAGQPALFSVAAGGPSAFDPADILAPSEPPVVVISRESLGLLPGDDIDALSDGGDFLSERFQNFPRFSVDPESRGVRGSAVRGEADSDPPEAHGDEFGLKPFGPDDSPCSGSGPNYLCYDENGVPGSLLAPRFGLLTADDLDALTEALPQRASRLFFSLAPGSPTLAALGAGPGDVLVSAPGAAPSIYARAEALGLHPGDDIDALCLQEDGDDQFDPSKDRVRFSLGRDSESLGGLRGRTAADILTGPPLSTVTGAAELGLNRRADNLNALKCRALP